MVAVVKANSSNSSFAPWGSSARPLLLFALSPLSVMVAKRSKLSTLPLVLFGLTRNLQAFAQPSLVSFLLYSIPSLTLVFCFS